MSLPDEERISGWHRRGCLRPGRPATARRTRSPWGNRQRARHRAGWSPGDAGAPSPTIRARRGIDAKQRTKHVDTRELYQRLSIWYSRTGSTGSATLTTGRSWPASLRRRAAHGASHRDRRGSDGQLQSGDHAPEERTLGQKTACWEAGISLKGRWEVIPARHATSGVAFQRQGAILLPQGPPLTDNLPTGSTRGAREGTSDPASVRR